MKEQDKSEAIHINAEQANDKRLAQNAVIQSGFNASKALLLVSGGSSVAMLAYMGQVKVQGVILDINIAKATMCFGISVILALLNTGFVYLATSYYAQHAYKNWKNIWNHRIGWILENIAIVLWAISFILLCRGGWFSLKSLFAINLNYTSFFTLFF